MELAQHNRKVLENQEPIDRYGAHFEYNDLCQRLLVVKKKQERLNPKIFKSFDKDSRHTPINMSVNKVKLKHSVRSNSVAKNSCRGVSSDFMKLFKIYSPLNRQKILTPEKLLSTIKTPTSFFGRRLFRKPINSKVFNIK